MDWPRILHECSQKMRAQVLTYYGSQDGATTLGVGAGGDLMKQIDVAAENALTKVLNQYDISYTLVSEESGITTIGSHPSEYVVITDPVDGTTNAIRGLPFMASVIAVARGPHLQDVEIALVSDLFHNVTYTAQKNRGASRNGKAINPAKTASLHESVIGFDYTSFKSEKLFRKTARLFQWAAHFRHFGANALEICYVADGLFDASIDLRGRSRVTDIAASYCILREAGGIMVTPDGQELQVPLDPTSHVAFIAASNNTIYEAIRDAFTLH